MAKNRFSNTGNKPVDDNLQDTYRLLNQQEDGLVETNEKVDNIKPIGTDEISGKGFVWDDLQVAISGARRPAASAPTWRTYAFGIGSGVAFEVLGFAVDDYIDFYVQTSHSMALNTILDNHIHWTIPSDSASDRIQWQLDVIAAGVNEAFAVPTGSPFTAEKTLAGTESDKHNLFEIAEIPAVNSTVSTAYICRLTRIDATQDEYGAEVYVIFSDCHFKADTVGSFQEGSKW